MYARGSRTKVVAYQTALLFVCASFRLTGRAAAEPAPHCNDVSYPEDGQVCMATQGGNLLQTGRIMSSVRPCSGTRTSRCCGDGVCDGPETQASCAEDCAGGAPAPAPGPSPPRPPSGARPCTDTRTSKCCGDDVCDGPETSANCAEDCARGAPAPTPGLSPRPPTIPAPSPGKPPTTACTDTRTSRCCGDGVCDGPETSANCAEDCAGGAPAPPPGLSPSPPSGPAPGPGKPPATACTTVPAVKPTEPTLCAAENQGCCECGSSKIKTYVFWTEGGSAQRCLHTYNLPSSAPSRGPMPVVLHMDGYSGGRKGSERGGAMGEAAEYYGFTVFTIGNNLKDGAGGFGLEFGNNGIANDDNPTPCSRTDSREIEFLEKVFQFIADRPDTLDASKVFTEGFSQNSMFAIYTAVCFADKVAGTWQGGSGQARTGFTPVTPGRQAQCSFESERNYGSDCCSTDFCKDCQYWPLWPATCSNKIVDCIASYTDDRIACGTDWYMYEAMVQEGNDARLLSFPVPAGDANAGHKDPKNKWAWFASCLGVAPTCSSSCAASFHACIDSASDAKAHEKFATCEKQLKAGALSGCTPGCAPSLSMLQRSEEPVVTLSEGKFGMETDLPKASGSAPTPNCKVPFGPLGTEPRQCAVPSGYTVPPINPKSTCSP